MIKFIVSCLFFLQSVFGYSNITGGLETLVANFNFHLQDSSEKPTFYLASLVASLGYEIAPFLELGVQSSYGTINQNSVSTKNKNGILHRVGGYLSYKAAKTICFSLASGHEYVSLKSKSLSHQGILGDWYGAFTNISVGTVVYKERFADVSLWLGGANSSLKPILNNQNKKVKLDRISVSLKYAMVLGG